MFITLFLISTDMYLRTNVPFQYTISEDREQVFLLYYKDFFEQICSDVQFISPPEEVGEFLLHLLKIKFYQTHYYYNMAILLCHVNKKHPKQKSDYIVGHPQCASSFLLSHFYFRYKLYILFKNPLGGQTPMP